MTFTDPTKDKRFIARVDQEHARFEPHGLRFESQFSDWTRLATNPNVADAIRYGSYTAYQRRDPMYYVHEQQAFAELLAQHHETLAFNKGCTVADLTPDETRWWLTSQDAMPPDVYSQGYPRLYVDGRYGFLRPHLRGEYQLMVAALEREHQIPPEHSSNNPDFADSLLTLKQWNELTHFLARLTLKWLDHGSVGKPELKIFPTLQKITENLRNYANPFFAMLEVLKAEFEVFATSDILMLAQQFDKCIFNGTTPVHTYVLAMQNFRETALKYTPSVELVEQHFSERSCCGLWHRRILSGPSVLGRNHPWSPWTRSGQLRCVDSTIDKHSGILSMDASTLKKMHRSFPFIREKFPSP